MPEGNRMHIIENLPESHSEQLHRLYQQAWWAHDRTIDEARQCLLGSQLTVGILDEQERLVAFARVLTDRIFKALVFDVIVDEAHRGTHLGNRLISHVLDHPSLSQVKHIELYCRDDVLDFYVSRGFQEQSSELHLMRLTRR